MRQTFRMRSVQSPIIPVVGELIRANPGTISLGQGVAYYGPPPEAVEHIQRFLADEENHKYGLVHGIPPLLDAIRRKLADDNGVTVGDDARIFVTAGGNMAFVNAVLAITDAGDEIILNLPYYFNHEMAVAIADCKAVCVPTDENYQLQPGRIAEAVTDRTRAVVTISPNNPTGAVYPEAALREVNALCRDRGIYHIHDEAYEYFVYEGARHFSPAAIEGSAGHTLSLFSLSKSYGFASWRIGYMVVPERLFVPIQKIQDTVLICPPVVSQWAAVGAMGVGGAYCRQKRQAIEAVRRIVLAEMAGVSDLLTVPPALGAFYFLLRVHTDLGDMELVERLIRDYRVAVIPGSTFGLTAGCCLRIAYGALELPTAAEALARFTRGLRGICG
ncbi:MAG TPA: pyridoxal phosphate-dependent aminotransferase [Phycisphaerae bacterium]|nr:pyridoxal phosphate-dependent aminotransferase [Phycisphaerae bacterium]